MKVNLVREFIRVRKGSATRRAKPEHVTRLVQEGVTGRAMAEIVSVLTGR
jgi:hypothetical protein